MKSKQVAQGLLSRALRLTGIIVVIYFSMVFYLALTERRNAYPRAIVHNEAQAAISQKAKPLSCTLDDGTVLEGWSVGTTNEPILLYYPDANEDGAQFLAEVQNISGVTLVAFNYRGSGNNSGTPSTENFEPDAEKIAECASQLNNQKPKYLAGRGTGAILAANQLGKDQKLIMIDPVLSIADAIAEKYRILYPKFLVRAPEKMPVDKLNQMLPNVKILSDRKIFNERSQKVYSQLKSVSFTQRKGLTLGEILTNLLL